MTDRQPLDLDEIEARANAATRCPEAVDNGRQDGQHTWRGSMAHLRCELCGYTRPRGERAGETVALVAEVRRLRATADTFRAEFGNIIVHGKDGDWANVADFIATGARIPVCDAFYPHHTDTRCVKHKGHRGGHRAPWGDRVMAWPRDPRETPFPAPAAGAQR